METFPFGIESSRAWELVRDDVTARKVREVGYAVVSLFDSETIAAMRCLVDDLRPDGGWGFDIGFASFDSMHRRRVAEALQPILLAELAPVLGDITPFLTTYAIKWPGPSGDLPLHQDWSYVDEDHDGVIIVWVPLVDTGLHLDNGPLRVVPRSHRFLAPLRGANSVPWYEPYRELLDGASSVLSVPAGHAVLFDSRLIHGSGPNLSRDYRPALTVRCAPSGCQLRYAHAKRSGGWSVYGVDPEFFVRHGPVELRTRMPDGYALLATTSERTVTVDKVGLASLVGSTVSPSLPAPRDGVMGLSRDPADRSAVIRTGVLGVWARSCIRRFVVGHFGSRITELEPGWSGPLPLKVGGFLVLDSPTPDPMVGVRVVDRCRPVETGDWVDADEMVDHEFWNWSTGHLTILSWAPGSRLSRLLKRYSDRR